MSRTRQALGVEVAEGIAAQAFAFLTEDSARLVRFLELTGLTPDQVRGQAHRSDFLAAVLEHLAGDESLLLVFAANASVAPETVASALAVLRQSSRTAARS